jgi:hypothetical protein
VVTGDDFNSKQGIKMKKLTIHKLADLNATDFCAHKNHAGLSAGDIYNRILGEIHAECLYDVDKVLHLPIDADVLKANIRNAVNRAIGKCRNLAKSNRAAIEPFQVRKVRENGGDVDRAYNLLGYDMRSYFTANLNNAKKAKYLKIAFKFMRPDDVKICQEYLDKGNWEDVAALHGMSEGDFRRKILPGLRDRAQKVWKKVW